MLGKALKALGVPRGEYIVSTKCGRYVDGFDFSAERVTKSIDESLERLQLSYVDILQCHDIEFGNLDQVLFRNSLFSFKNISFRFFQLIPLGFFFLNSCPTLSACWLNLVLLITDRE